MSLTNILIRDNNTEDSGGGLSIISSDFSLENVIISGNSAEDDGGGILIGNSDSDFNHVTIIGNIVWGDGSGIFDRGGSTLTFKNGIIWNGISNFNPMSINITHSNIQDGWIGEGNIETDPQLDSLYMPKWDENHYSPCIDSGDPLSTWDEDGSPPDMGAVPTINHKYDNWELPSRFTDRGWRWMSFPALDTLTSVYNGIDLEYDGDMAEYLLADILDVDILNHVEWKPPLNNDPPREFIRYINNEWSHLDHTFTSSQGYKIWMVGQEPVSLPVSGFLEDIETSIPLWANQDNWVGYFLEKSRKPLEAFSPYVLEHLTSITAQHWYMIKDNGVWTSNSTDGRFDYGGMYILTADTSLIFKWQPPSETLNSFTFTPTDNFQFEELADYTPVIIDTVENGETVEEIGIFVNDECIGAEKVTEYPVHLRAYKGNRSLENMSFEVVRQEGSGKLREGEEAVLIKESAKIHYVDVVEADNHRPVYRVSLKANEIRSIATLPVSYRLGNNYPNPFNPVTTIAYDIPEDGWVNLRVYDITGRQVDELVNTRIKAGFHSVKWDATEFSSGLYFVSIHARGNNGGKDFTSTKKMMMIK